MKYVSIVPLVIKRFLLMACLPTTCLLMLGSCTHNKESITSAPPFDYSTSQNLRSEMHKFAYQMQMLDWAIRGNKDNPRKKQREVVSALKQMKLIADGLITEQNIATHPFIENYTRDFLIRIDHATIAASQNPPSYYLVGQISGGCISCHWVRDKNLNQQ